MPSNKPPFPSDECGEVLQQLWDDGADFSKAHSIDFYIAAPSEAIAKSIGELLHEKDFEIELAFDEEDKEWAVVCICEMMLDHNTISQREKELEKLSAPLGGENDGWGTFPEE